MTLTRILGAAALTLGLALPALAQDKTKVGFIYVGPVGDGGWTYEHDQGRLAVEEHFGDQVETVFQESVPEGADAERAILLPILLTKTAAEWEDWFQDHHIPAARIWTLPETLAHGQLESRDILHHYENEPGIPGKITAPKAAFKLDHGGARIDRPPPRLGEHNEELLAELGYSAEEIANLRATGAI